MEEQWQTETPVCMWVKIKSKAEAHSLINPADDAVCDLKDVALLQPNDKVGPEEDSSHTVTGIPCMGRVGVSWLHKDNVFGF